jgi:hypothetical protein
MMSSLRYFKDELDAHYLRGECPAGVCRPIGLGAGAPASRSNDTRAAAGASA